MHAPLTVTLSVIAVLHQRRKLHICAVADNIGVVVDLYVRIAHYTEVHHLDKPLFRRRINLSYGNDEHSVIDRHFIAVKKRSNRILSTICVVKEHEVRLDTSALVLCIAITCCLDRSWLGC